MDIKLQGLINRTKNKKEMQIFLQIEPLNYYFCYFIIDHDYQIN